MERFLPTSTTLKSSTDDQLEALYDREVGWANDQSNVVNSVNSAVAKATFIRDELHRRSVESSSRTIQHLTWVITVLTAVNVGAVIVALFQ